jgi:hypothetical protein
LSQAATRFTWSGGVGVSHFWLDVGTALGGTNVASLNTGRQLGADVADLPLNGAPVFVRLWSRIAGEWTFIDYRYTTRSGAPQAAELLTPAAGSTLPSTTVPFTWSGGRGVDQYWIYVGTTVGGAQISSQDRGLQLTATVTGLPTGGQTIHVRLWSRTGAVWAYTDYVFQAVDVATLVAGGGG